MICKQNLDEISFIRPVLIVLLVLYHAFCPWTGAWEEFDGFETIETYRWIADFAYSFLLPMFVFQSGYVWAFQREVKGLKESLQKLAVKKTKRLLVPSIIFSTAYVLVFYNVLPELCVTEWGGGKTLIISILNGAGHMWFLPMLFWCFIISWLLLQITNESLKYTIILFLFIISFLPLPLRINSAFEYVLYFIFGYNVLLSRNSIIKYITVRKIALIWLVFIITFAFSSVFKDSIDIYKSSQSNLLIKCILVLIEKFITVAYSMIGIVCLYITAIFYTNKYSINKKIISLGKLCFGVYLFQQFILKWFYYATDYPQKLGLFLPWVAFIGALISSLVLSYMLRQTRIGRKYM